MDRCKPPKPLNLDGNLQQNWKSWRQDFILFMAATKYDEKPDNVKSSLLLDCISERAREVCNTFKFSTTADSMKLETIIEQFGAYSNPRKNITYSQFKFFTYHHQIGQSFDNNMTELRKLSSDCELEGQLQERLLRESNLA